MVNSDGHLRLKKNEGVQLVHPPAVRVLNQIIYPFQFTAIQTTLLSGIIHWNQLPSTVLSIRPRHEQDELYGGRREVRKTSSGDLGCIDDRVKVSLS